MSDFEFPSPNDVLQLDWEDVEVQKILNEVSLSLNLEDLLEFALFKPQRGSFFFFLVCFLFLVFGTILY
jgi:hypothetical protein